MKRINPAAGSLMGATGRGTPRPVPSTPPCAQVSACRDLWHPVGRLTRPCISLSLLLAATASAQPANGPYDAAMATLQQRNVAQQKAAVGNADQKTWDYVLADKKAGTVTVGKPAAE